MKGIEGQESTDVHYRKILDKVSEALLEIPSDATEEDLKNFRSVIDEHIDVLSALLQKDQFAREALRNLSFIALAHEGCGVPCTEQEYENGLKAREIMFANKGRILEIALQEEINPRYGFLIFMNDIPGYADEMNAYLAEEVLKAGLDLTALEEAWSKSGNEKEFENHRMYNIFQLLKLESLAPGAPKALFDRFGISTFARYPLQTLLKQFESIDTLDMPYGILLYPRSDWNGVFYNSVQMIEHFDASLEEDFLLRIIECQSGTEIARRLLSLQHTYEAEGGEKIAFAVIGGHGNQHTIVFGDREKGQEIDIEALGGPGLKRARSLFSPEAVFVLSSCSTGVEGGVAQEFSRIFDATVIAPDANTSTESVTYKAEVADFDVNYRGARALRYKSGALVLKE